LIVLTISLERSRMSLTVARMSPTASRASLTFLRMLTRPTKPPDMVPSIFMAFEKDGIMAVVVVVGSSRGSSAAQRKMFCRREKEERNEGGREALHRRNPKAS
jgi:hypothetical protein